MRTSRTVQKILSHYEGETPGVKANLARILNEGQLRGTGGLVTFSLRAGHPTSAPHHSINPSPRQRFLR